MSRKLSTAALMAACLTVPALFVTTNAVAERKNAMGYSLANLYCDFQRDEALRQAHQLRGGERESAREAAFKAWRACHAKARKANQVEDVMPRLVPR